MQDKFCRRQSNPSHNAHVLKRAKIYYRWHALYKQSLRVERIVSRYDGTFIHCELPDGSIGAFPAWMMNAEACAQFTLGIPKLSVEAISNLSKFLNELRLESGHTLGSDKLNPEVSQHDSRKVIQTSRTSAQSGAEHIRTGDQREGKTHTRGKIRTHRRSGRSARELCSRKNAK